MSGEVSGIRVLRDWCVSIGAEVGTTSANLVAGILIARALGAEGKGALAIASTVAAMLAAVLNLRWERACGHVLARNKAALPTVFTSTLIMAGVAMLAAAGLWGIVSARGWFRTDIPAAFQWGILGLIGSQALYVGIAAMFGGLREFATRSRFLLSYNALQAAAVVVLYLAGGRHAGEYLAMSVIVAWATLLFWIHELVRGYRIVPALDRSLLGDIARFSGRSYFTLLLDLVTMRVDMLLLGLLVSPAAAGVYSIAVAVGARLASIPQIVGYVVFHRTSASELGEGARTARIFRLAAVAMFVTGLSAAVVTSLVVVPLYGSEFALAVPALWIMIPAAGIWGLYRLLTSDIEGRGYPGLVALTSLGASMTVVGLDLVWIPSHGVLGAAWASFVGYSVALCLAGVLFCRVVGLTPRQAYGYCRGDIGALIRVASELGRRASFRPA